MAMEVGIKGRKGKLVFVLKKLEVEKEKNEKIN